MDRRQTEWNHMQEKQGEAMNVMYQNTGASHFERIERKSLIIDVQNPNIDFNEELHDPLVIDKLSDIYLDSFTTLRSKDNNNSDEDIAFLLSINEFNINSTSNTSIIHNKVIIPNSTEDNSDPSSGGDPTITHKNKKFNYICSINPCKLSRLTGKISLLNGGNAFAEDEPQPTTRFIAEFVIISRE
tara:strand:- start:30 stop:587 length:558 start_codon:yes stop_codon:yes gene_type:complete